MFHILEKIFINLLCPVICIAVEVVIKKKSGREYYLKDIILKWLAF